MSTALDVKNHPAAGISQKPGAIPPGELRRGFGPVIGLAVLVAALVVMFTNTERWQGHWGSTIGQLHTIGILLAGPITVGGGCWLGGRERRRGLEELRASAPRGALSQTVAACLPAIVWPALGYLLAALVTMAATWPYAAAGFPPLTLLAADITAIAALGTIGFVVGRLVAWRLAAPTLAVVGYVGLGMTAYNSNSAVTWLSPTVGHYHLWEQPVWWYGPVLIVWTGGLAAAALLFVARRLVPAAALVAAAVAAAVLLIHTGDGVWKPDRDTSALVCTSDAPKVCVTKLNSEQLPGVAAAAKVTYDKLEGVSPLPVRWSEHPFAEFGDKLRAGEENLGLGVGDTYVNPTKGRRITSPDRYLPEIAHGLAYPNCPTARWQYPRASEAVVEWLSGTPDPAITYREPRPKSIDRAIERLHSMPKVERAAWLKQYFDAVADCDPKKVTMP
ncbi:MAG: hypothetical protein ACRDP3_09845 [Streptomyces sp.]|uniref:hypothetical protein n=1 Tax=Streptomyces sp. TaxID=1931 RepID=UPI003D6B13A7